MCVCVCKCVFVFVSVCVCMVDVVTWSTDSIGVQGLVFPDGLVGGGVQHGPHDLVKALVGVPLQGAGLFPVNQTPAKTYREGGGDHNSTTATTTTTTTTDTDCTLKRRRGWSLIKTTQQIKVKISIQPGINEKSNKPSKFYHHFKVKQLNAVNSTSANFTWPIHKVWLLHMHILLTV